MALQNSAGKRNKWGGGEKASMLKIKIGPHVGGYGLNCDIEGVGVSFMNQSSLFLASV